MSDCRPTAGRRFSCMAGPVLLSSSVVSTDRLAGLFVKKRHLREYAGTERNQKEPHVLRKLAVELRSHIPFTIFGTVLGVAVMLAVVLGDVPERVSYWLFYSFHPLHVLVSAIATAGIYTRYGRKSLPIVLVVGFVGSIGIATLSDSIIPYVGEWLLGLHVDPHGHGHGHNHNGGAHIGFIDKWWMVNPLAIAGILIGYYRPRTKMPHGLHVLTSVAASTFHMVMALKGEIDVFTALAMSAFLFIAVWVPCCTSDIVFPLLLTGRADAPHDGGGHGHRHKHEHEKE